MLDDGDVNKINWATLTLDHLIASLKQYKNNKQTNLAGNLALLQVIRNDKLFLPHSNLVMLWFCDSIILTVLQCRRGTARNSMWAKLSTI